MTGAVVAGAVVTFFLLLILLIIGIVIGMMLRRAQQGKSCFPAKKEAGSYPLRTRASEQQADVEVETQYDRLETHGEVPHGERDGVLAPHYDRLPPHENVADDDRAEVPEPYYDRLGLYEEVPHSERDDVPGKSRSGWVKFEGGNCNFVEAVEVPSQDEVGPHYNAKAEGQQVDRPQSTPIAVFTGEDKSKMTGKTSRDLSAATTQGIHKEKQHNERSDVFRHEPCDSSRVYAEVDKSKKQKNGKTEGGPGATTIQGIYPEEQHYECSDVVGQDWFGNVVEEKYEGNHGDDGKGSPSSLPSQPSEPCTPNVVYAVVDKSKKRKKEKMNGAPSLTAAHVEEGGAQKQNSSGREACEGNTQQNDNEQSGGRLVPKRC